MFLFLLKWVASIDVVANEEANANILVKLCESFTDQAAQVGGAKVLTSPRRVSVSTQGLLNCLSCCHLLSIYTAKVISCLVTTSPVFWTSNLFSLLAVLCLPLTSDAVNNSLSSKAPIGGVLFMPQHCVSCFVVLLHYCAFTLEIVNPETL